MLWVSGRGCVCVCAYLGALLSLVCSCLVFVNWRFFWGTSFDFPHLLTHFCCQAAVCPLPGVCCGLGVLEGQDGNLLWFCRGEQGWDFPPQWGWHFVQLHLGVQCVTLPSLVLQAWGNSPQNVFKMLLECLHFMTNVHFLVLKCLWQVVPQDGNIYGLTLFFSPFSFNN